MCVFLTSSLTGLLLQLSNVYYRYKKIYIQKIMNLFVRLGNNGSLRKAHGDETLSGGSVRVNR